MTFTIQTLIQTLNKAAEAADEGLETPVIFEAGTTNKEMCEVLTTIDFGSVDIISGLDGEFLSMEFLIKDDNLNRLIWTKNGCP